MVLFFFGGSVFARRAKTEPPKGKKFVVCVRPIFFQAKQNRQRVRKLWYAYVLFSAGRKQNLQRVRNPWYAYVLFSSFVGRIRPAGRKTTDKQ